MPALRQPVATPFPSAVHHHRRPRRLFTAIVLVAVLVAGAAVYLLHRDTRHRYFDDGMWPIQGQASFSVGSGDIESSPDQPSVPIASVAKVMTAYLVLRAAPIGTDSDGFRLTVTDADVADTAARQRNDESVVKVRAGEVLTERQALAALLLPSANNIAVMLARKIGGSVEAFVADMNDAADRLHMTHTTYTDPSGLDPGTRSTATDQVRLAQAAMREPLLASLVGLTAYVLPVAGVVYNTDTLIGTDGFVGIKTGSDDAAGGCFMFRSRRVVDGRSIEVTGVVLGQPGDDLIAAGLQAAVQLVRRLGSQ